MFPHMKWLGVLFGSLLVTLDATSAFAFSRGVGFNGCDGCHGPGDQVTMLTTTPGQVSPGSAVDVELVVSGGSGRGLGLYILATEGSLQPGPGLRRQGDGLTHDGSPLNYSGGRATVRFRWTAPSSPGATRFDISTVVSDNDGGRQGDAARDTSADVVFGCDSQEFFRDRDGDGYGLDDEMRLFCQGDPPDGWAARGEDCADFDEDAFPGGAEVCNRRDDDCDETVDEGSADVTLYPDRDRDGYYSREERETGETREGCAEEGSRWASEGGDCAPDDPEVNPGVEETCNGWDDDCDLDVDERVRPICGVGACRRASFSCEEADCRPAEPQGETCNFLDDDCDGNVDEDSCPAGELCVEFECVPASSVDAGPAPAGDGGTAGSPAPPPMTGGCSGGSPDGGLPGGGWGSWAFALLLVLIGRRHRSKSQANPR